MFGFLFSVEFGFFVVGKFKKYIDVFGNCNCGFMIVLFKELLL